MSFLITNLTADLDTPKSIDIIEGWKLCFDPNNLVADEKGNYPVKLHGMVNSIKDGVHTQIAVEDNFSIDPTVYKPWTEWAHECPKDFILATVLEMDEDEGYSLLTGSTSDVDLMLEVFIPGVCGCGDPHSALESTNEVLFSFNQHPLVYREPTTEVDQIYVDMLRLIILSANGIIYREDPKDVGVLTSKGQMLALAMAVSVNED